MVKNSRGYPRATLDSEIEAAQNLLLDFDFNSIPTQEQRTEFAQFLQRSHEYIQDLGLRIPAWAFTGRGYHLLFGYRPIRVAECPDIAARLKQFRHQFLNAHRRDLQALEAKLDNTQDLRRMARVYGTAKPEVGILSEFHGGERVEDAVLRQYLLEVKVQEAADKLPATEGGPRNVRD